MHARPDPGECQMLEPGVRRVLAPNPSAMTGWGTNTYLVGTQDVAVIDPGPMLADHQAAILAALQPRERISAIFVTHPHLDHSALARPLARVTEARIYGFGPPGSGRSPIMQHLAASGLAGGGEGVDQAFAPDTTLADETTIHGGDWALRAIHTPGHFAGHLCFAWKDRLFSGDHAMGWASSLVSPPDGDMADYMASLAKLARQSWHTMYPAHGAPVSNPAARLEELSTHRHDRETAIMAALADGQSGLDELTATVYAGTAPHLLPAAARSLFAHLIDLERRNCISAEPSLSPAARFHLV